MWNIKKKSGVSPVIATILMVAITVVLAAVLYVMVMNMSGNQGTSTPQGSFASTTTDGRYVNITFGSFSTNVGVSAIKFVVENVTSGQSATFTATLNSNLAPLTGVAGASSIAGGITLIGQATPTRAGIIYVDVANNGHINVGDSLSILNNGVGSGNNLKITMIYISSGDVINYLNFSY
ncbi:MAG: type IV pilin N-terminal domain-containing protein [Methanomassiliicoccales archaeon]